MNSSRRSKCCNHVLDKQAIHRGDKCLLWQAKGGNGTCVVCALFFMFTCMGFVQGLQSFAVLYSHVFGRTAQESCLREPTVCPLLGGLLKKLFQERVHKQMVYNKQLQSQ